MTMPRPLYPAKFFSHGFSLVELLVVLSVIALIVAIALPVLSHHRESAVRASCTSNLRQMHQLFTLYATSHREQVPLGYRHSKQFNSMIYSATSQPDGNFVLLGLLYKDGLLDSPSVCFCPAETNQQLMHNTAANPWPPGPKGDPTRNVHGGYGCRPQVEIHDDLSERLPRLSEFRENAILADLVSVPERVETRHRDGINVLYGNGAVHWVDLERFQEPLEACTSVSFTGEFDEYQDELWEAIDLPPIVYR